ncbi:hypothetical protein EWM64_g8596 [Hericium alpestre]|uniref:Uncharacterized protein n=1 Tax=Hericium alpestre TaxID=135208 RepID=A0A4Y9ZMV3_9AGAM|nr:hypothetical protein EWM64_g8596 [Hericium alpestre]
MNAKQIVKQKTRQSKVLSSRDYRKRTSSGIASLRERVFPGSVKKGTRRPRVAAVKDMDKDETETSELDVILEACKKIDDGREKIKQLEDSNEKLKDSNEKLKDSNEKLKDSYKKLEDYIKKLEDRNKTLEDNIKVLDVDYAAADRRGVDNYSWLFENLESDEVRA